MTVRVGGVFVSSDEEGRGCVGVCDCEGVGFVGAFGPGVADVRLVGDLHLSGAVEFVFDHGEFADELGVVGYRDVSAHESVFEFVVHLGSEVCVHVSVSGFSGCVDAEYGELSAGHFHDAVEYGGA